MSHRTDAEGSINAARLTVAELTKEPVPAVLAAATAAHAQAIATAAVAQALLAVDDTLRKIAEQHR